MDQQHCRSWRSPPAHSFRAWVLSTPGRCRRAQMPNPYDRSLLPKVASMLKVISRGSCA